MQGVQFQPTLPARGATAASPTLTVQTCYFNPRSPHGERLRHTKSRTRSGNFNPRSPHGERQTATGADRLPNQAFQPTLPARGATPAGGAVRASACISTHAPRTGSDSATKRRQRPHKHFNPRSPHGERLEFEGRTYTTVEFQPTLPARGATPSGGQSHRRSSRFQPTLPARGATTARRSRCW